MSRSVRTAEQVWRRRALGLAVVAMVALAVAGGLLVERWRELQRPALVRAETAAVRRLEEPERPDRLLLRDASFDQLPSWADDAVAEAVPALRRSCDVWAAREPAAPAARSPLAGRVEDWRPFCTALDGLPPGDDTGLRAAIVAHLRPWSVTNHGEGTGLVTGYYEPTLAGSRRRDARYRVPLYLRPSELVTVDLGAFREDLAGRRIAGRVDGGTLAPYADRGAIEAGALTGRGLELVWVDDPVDAFFLHIQGSGRVELAEGGTLRVGYAAPNGHPYRAIGRELVERNELALEEVSMQSIRRWLVDHPDRADEIMNTNESFIFFRRLEGEGPVGTLGVALTPGRSVAVDRRFLPLGAPLWLDASAPSPDEAAADVSLQRLFVAQDTGGAIRGPVRADVFWGPGRDAAAVAGRMKHEGRIFLFLPRTLDPPAELLEGGGV